MKRLLGLIGSVLLVAALSSVCTWLYLKPAEIRIGSVTQANEYSSTSTSYLAGTLAPLIVDGPGALGSVVITGANTGSITFYNATTTNKNLRTGQAPTSTIILGTIVASQAAGTYTFDTSFTNGLLADVSGLAPTSTITYRKY